MQKRNHFHRLQQKHYSRGTYRNPYFQAPKKDPKHILFAAAGLVCVLIFAAIYFCSYPAFTLQRVETRGLDASSNLQFESQIRDYLNESHLFFFHNTNQFLFSEKKFRESLSKRFAFDKLDIHIKNHVVYLDVKERTSDIVWRSNGEGYLADLNGVITEHIETMTPADQNLPVLVDKNNQVVNVGDHVLTDSVLKNILSFQQLLTLQNISFTETQIDLQTGKWMGVLTKEGYRILFDQNGDLQAQSDRLKTILRDTIKDTSHLQYIDLRFGDHVYYK